MSSEFCQLSEIADVQGGYAFKSADFGAEGVAVIKIANIQPPQVSLAGVDRVSPDKVKGLERFELKDGDILMAMTGATVGKVGRFRRAESAYLNQRVARVTAKKGRQFDNFIYAVLSLPGFDKLIEGSSAGSAQANISAAGIGSVKIPRLLETDQLLIGNLARLLDDRIALLRETNATLEAIAQAMFKSWFVDFDPVHAKQQGRAPEGMSETTAALFPDSFEETELGLVPRGWAVGSIGKVAEVIDCLHAKKPELLESGSPYLQLNNIRDDGLLDTANLAFVSDADYTKWISRIEVSGGDCVITNVGRVGAVAQIPESFRAAMGRNMTAIRMRKEWPYPTYLVELLQSPWMETEIQRRTDIGTILNALNVKNIPLLRCVLADHNLLKEFEDTARPLRAAMEANLERANNLATLRDTLLPRLISGNIKLEANDSLGRQ